MELTQYQHETAGRRGNLEFCSDNCNLEYDNSISLVDHAEINRVINILKQNRHILKILLNGREELLVRKELLRRRGFDFLHHTRQVWNGQGSPFMLCFNYGYRLIKEDQIKVFHWKQG